MGYNARNDEIRDNITRMRREWEAQRGALATVRRFNATLSAKGYVWFWPKIAAALTSKHHWLITIVEDAFGVVCAVLVLRLSLLASQPPTVMRKTPTTSPNPTKICTPRSRWLSLVFVLRFDIARILLGAERTVEPNARFEG